MVNLYGNPWALAVGRFVLAFSEIEHTTIALLGWLPECHIPNTAPQLDLRRRFDILEEVLFHSEKADYAATLEALRRAQKLLGQRNLLAHNGVWFDVYKDGDQVVLRSSLVSARNRTIALSLEQVEDLADKAQDAAANLTHAAQVLMHPIADPAD